MFKREQGIRIDSHDYYVIDVIKYENEEYIYVQEMIDDEFIESYKIYRYNEKTDELVQEKENEKLETLLKMFVENIQKDLGEE